MSQSAASHALARLRDACRDELFVRSAAGIAPTAVAQHMYPEVRKALDGLRRSLGEAQGFDPKSSTRRFSLAIPHPAGPIWGLAISDKAKAAAPGVTFDFNTRTMPFDTTGRMLSGEIDLRYWLPAEGDRFVNRKLFTDELVFVARHGHPRITPDIDAAALRKERFISIHPRTQFGPDYLQEVRRAYFDLDIAILVNEALEIPYRFANRPHWLHSAQPGRELWRRGSVPNRAGPDLGKADTDLSRLARVAADRLGACVVADDRRRNRDRRDEAMTRVCLSIMHAIDSHVQEDE